MAVDLMLEALHTAEDGLSPDDALTPEEALARILVLFRMHYQDFEVETDALSKMYYGDDPIVGGAPVTCIMRWSEDRPGESASWRDRLERAGLLSRWG
jgi:hypothetical protein